MQHDYILTLTAYMYIYEPLILCLSSNKIKLWYLSKLSKRMTCSNSTKMLQSINIPVKVQTQKGIYGAVLTVQYLPSGEHKNYDLVLTSNSTNTKHIFG